MSSVGVFGFSLLASLCTVRWQIEHRIRERDKSESSVRLVVKRLTDHNHKCLNYIFTLRAEKRYCVCKAIKHNWAACGVHVPMYLPILSGLES